MNKSEDYPATHSMDTEWFAVDRNGRIAIFDPFDEGCVPLKIFNEKFQTTFEDELFTLFPLNDMGFPQMTLPEENLNRIKELMTPWQPELYLEDDFFHIGGICRFTPDSDLSIFLQGNAPQDTSLLLLSPKEKIAVISTYDREAIEKLASRQQITHILSMEINILTETEPKIADLLGFFGYENYRDSRETYMPYMKSVNPDLPVTFNQINMLNSEYLTRLPVDFKNDAEVQPMKYIPCQIFGNYKNYKNPDGSIFPIPPENDEKQ